MAWFSNLSVCESDQKFSILNIFNPKLLVSLLVSIGLSGFVGFSVFRCNSTTKGNYLRKTQGKNN